MANDTKLPYDAMKISVVDLADQLVQFHGGSFHESMYEKGHIEGVISYGPPGIGKTQSIMSAAARIAAENGYELVIYRPGVKRNPAKKQMLFVHMSMAGMTSGRVAGFPTTAISEKITPSDTPEAQIEKQQNYVSRQVIPTIWRTAMEFPAAMYLFDEITHVISQESMLSLLSEGFYEETKLSQRALFVATANEGIADGTLQQKLSTAFRNRLTAYYIQGDVDVWRKQYANNIVHPACLAFASMYKPKFESFQAPENNLLNTPTLRSLTKLSESIQYFEMRNFRKMKELPNGDKTLDPKGEYKEEIKITPAQEAMLMRIAFGSFGKDSIAQDFVSMYTLAYTQVIPEIKNVINGKPTSDSFRLALSIDDAESVKMQKELLKGTDRTDSKMKVAQDNVAKSYTYVDYLPRMLLDTWAGLPTNPKIIEKGYHDSPEKLRAMTHQLMTNFLKGVLLLPSNMQIMALQHMMELCDTPEMKEAGKPFSDESFKSESASIPQLILFNVISTNAEKPEYRKLQNAISDMQEAKNIADDLKI